MTDPDAALDGAELDDDIDVECEVWVGWIDAPCDVIRVRARVVRVGRPCISCGHVIREPDEHPFPDHAEDCALVIERRVEALARAHEPTTGSKTPLTRKEVRALLDEGKQIRAVVEARVDAMERIPEADRAKRCR